MDKLNNLLKKDSNQRVIYLVGLLFWIFISFDSLKKYPLSESSIGVNYLTLFLIPSIILLVQILRNNKIIWILIFGLFSGYIVFTVILLITDILQRGGNHIKAIDWNFGSVFGLIFGISLLGIIDFIIYKLKPKRLI